MALCRRWFIQISALSTFDDKGSIPEREPEKRLPHPRKAAGAQITQSRLGEVVTINTDTGLFWVLQLWDSQCRARKGVGLLPQCDSRLELYQLVHVFICVKEVLQFWAQGSQAVTDSRRAGRLQDAELGGATLPGTEDASPDSLRKANSVASLGNAIAVATRAKEWAHCCKYQWAGGLSQWDDPASLMLELRRRSLLLPGGGGTPEAVGPWPILWRAGVTSGRRNARKGVGTTWCLWPKYEGAMHPNRWMHAGSLARVKEHTAVWLSRGNNAVMPLDVLGRTRATLTEPTSSSPWPKGLGNLVKLCRAGDRALQLLLFNEEFLYITRYRAWGTASQQFLPLKVDLGSVSGLEATLSNCSGTSCYFQATALASKERAVHPVSSCSSKYSNENFED
ncbi:hypothetical protein B7494_g5236 [Chlorociboria aeruginascens]|nr:hypothetical protein B7494_g5236 [Chlorociboria aeruginascens]